VPHIKESYERLTTHEEIGPTGQLYRWRDPNHVEYATLLGGIPGLLKDGKAPTVADKDAIAKAADFNAKLVEMCLVYPVVRTNGGPEPTEDWLYLNEIASIDVNWLAVKIQTGKAKPQEAAEAGRVL
jgi:hypothetical protein